MVKIFHILYILNILKYFEGFTNELIFNIDLLDEYTLNLGGGYNYIDVYNLIPKELNGLSIGYKLYKYILDKVDFIMSNNDSSNESKNLWYNLMKDDEVYSGTNERYSTIIKKEYSR